LSSLSYAIEYVIWWMSIGLINVITRSTHLRPWISLILNGGQKPDGYWKLMRLTPAFPISFRFSAQRLMDSLLPQAKDRVLFVPSQQPRRKRGGRGGGRG
jgi:hypothetical protein